MAKATTKRATRKDKATAPAPDHRVPVMIRAGHTHRDLLYTEDTAYMATPQEAALLQRFGALTGGG